MYSLFNIHSHRAGRANEITIINIHEGFQNPLPNGYFSAGIHPRYIQSENHELQFEALAKLLQQPSVIAVGECGLDKLCDSDWSVQLDVFSRQIKLANQINKPLIIHCVRAFEEIQKSLKENKFHVPVIFHGFTKNSSILAQTLIKSGAYLSFGKGLFQESVAALFKQFPDDRFFLETDNSEYSIQSIYERAAEIKNVSLNELMSIVLANKNLIFGTIND